MQQTYASGLGGKPGICSIKCNVQERRLYCFDIEMQPVDSDMGNRCLMMLMMMMIVCTLYLSVQSMSTLCQSKQYLQTVSLCLFVQLMSTQCVDIEWIIQYLQAVSVYSNTLFLIHHYVVIKEKIFFFHPIIDMIFLLSFFSLSGQRTIKVLFLLSVGVSLVPLFSWALCYVGNWHQILGHCKGMFQS